MEKLLYVLALGSLSFMITIVPLPYVNESFILSDLLWSTIIIISVLAGLLRKKYYLSIPFGLYKPIMIFTFLVLVTSFVTIYYRLPGRSFFSLELFGPSLFYIFRYGLFIISFAAFYRWLVNIKNLILSIKTVLIFGLLVEIIVICQFLGILPDFWPMQKLQELPYHVGPLSYNHSHIGGYLIILLGLTFQVLESKKRILPKTVLFVIVVLIYLCTLISGKRAAWASVILFLVLHSFYNPFVNKITIKRFVLYVFSVISLVFIFYAIRFHPILNKAIYEVYDFETGSIARGGNLEGRLDAIAAYLQYFSQKPLNYLIGTGYCSTFTYVVIYGGAYFKKLGGPHNQFVSILFEMGIPGLLTFIWLLIEMYRVPIIKAKLYKRLRASVPTIINTLTALIFFSLGGAFFFVGTLYGNLTLFFFIYFALAVRYLDYEAVCIKVSRECLNYNESSNMPK